MNRQERQGSPRFPRPLWERVGVRGSCELPAVGCQPSSSRAQHSPLSVFLPRMAYGVQRPDHWAQRLHNRVQTPTFSGDDSRVLARLK